MANYAEYEIFIADPKKAKQSPSGGCVGHDVYKVDASRSRRPANNVEMKAYRTARKDNALEDLDFHVHFKGTTQLTFRLPNSGSWIFSSTPITVDDGTVGVKTSDNIAILSVPGAGREGPDKLKYTLFYEHRDGDEKPFNHDPIIYNGSIPPFIGTIVDP